MLSDICKSSEANNNVFGIPPHKTLYWLHAHCLPWIESTIQIQPPFRSTLLFHPSVTTLSLADSDRQCKHVCLFSGVQAPAIPTRITYSNL